MTNVVPEIGAILEQSRTGFQPAVNVMLDTSQMRQLFENLCAQVLKLSNEVEALRGQLGQKADSDDVVRLNNFVNQEATKNADNFNQVNKNIAELREALVAGLDRVLKDEDKPAKDLVAEIKIPDPVVVERNVLSKKPLTERKTARSAVYLISPHPTSDLSELRDQVTLLGRRVAAIEKQKGGEEHGDSDGEDEKKAKKSEEQKKSDEVESEAREKHAVRPRGRAEYGDEDGKGKSDEQVSEFPELAEDSDDLGIQSLNSARGVDELYELNHRIKGLNQRLNALEEGLEPDVKVMTKDSHEDGGAKAQETPKAKVKIIQKEIIQRELPGDVMDTLNHLQDSVNSLLEDVDALKRDKGGDGAKGGDLVDRLKAAEDNIEKFGNFANQLQRDVNLQKGTLGRVEKAANEALSMAKEARKKSGQPGDASTEQTEDEQEKKEGEENKKEQVDGARPRPSLGSLNTDELLDAFMDAAKMEMDKMKREIMDDMAGNMKNMSNQISGNISKATADMDDGLKKCNTKIQDQGTQLQTDMNTLKSEQEDAVKNLEVKDSEMLDRIKAIEQRLDRLTDAANEKPPTMDTLITDDGKIDLGPILKHLATQMTLGQDLMGRVTALEQKDVVQPTAFNSAVETLNAVKQKVGDMEVAAVAMNNKLAEMKEMQEELKRRQASASDEEQFQDLKGIVSSLEDEMKRVRDGMMKMNKEIITCRAAINGLKSGSEEAANGMEEMSKIASDAREDTASVKKRLKKAMEQFENETKEINNKIDDLYEAIENNNNRLDELASTGKLSESSRSKKGESSPKALLSPDRKNTKGASPTKDYDQFSYASDPVATNDAGPALPEPQIIPIVKPKQIEVDTSAPVRQIKPLLPRLKPSGTQGKGSDVTRQDLRRYDELFARMDKAENAFTHLKSAIDTLNKSTKTLQDIKADKDALQSLFDQFRLAMGELNSRVGSLRKAIVQKADVTELKQLRNDVTKDIQAQGETAAGTETIRCLLCGNPRHNVSQAIPVSEEMAEKGGPPISAPMQGIDGKGNPCFVYSQGGEMFLGRSMDGKPIIMKQLFGGSSLDSYRLPEGQETNTQHSGRT